jgi:hypothetical protein
LLAPDQRREPLAVQRLESALGAAFALDPESRERLGEALQAHGSEIGQLEQTTQQVARAHGHDDRARLGQGLKSRC